MTTPHFLGASLICSLFFFFSSRRRHTRYWRDWSSDVCSSDLAKFRRRLARRLEDIAERKATPEFRVRLRIESLSEGTLDLLEELFAGSPGSTPVLFELQSPDGSVAGLQATQRATVKAELIESARQIGGGQASGLVT